MEESPPGARLLTRTAAASAEVPSGATPANLMRYLVHSPEPGYWYVEVSGEKVLTLSVDPSNTLTRT